MIRGRPLLRVLGLLAAVAACGGEGARGGSSGAGTATSTGAAGTTVPASEDPAGINRGEINLDCTEMAPITGARAQRGECCHRSSNAERLAALGPDESGVLEYRLQSVKVVNHPLSIGDPTLLGVNKARYDNEEQSVLWRFEVPRANGAPVPGAGTATFGTGRYNCDGTYSYFGPEAAPMRGIPKGDDPARWLPFEVPAAVTMTDHGLDPSRIAFPDNRNRKLTRVPFVLPGSYLLEWELVQQGFEIESIDILGGGNDCVGSRDGVEWVAGGTFRIFTPLEGNDSEIIQVVGTDYCHLVAFGLLTPTASCRDTPRCAVGSANCAWIKLPDSLCPDTEEERAMWGCHVADPDNPDGEPTNCTAEAPAEPLDPAQGAASEGQCCDPLGHSNTLPACNAWMLRQEYVAAAAEITDEPSNELPSACD